MLLVFFVVQCVELKRFANDFDVALGESSQGRSVREGEMIQGDVIGEPDAIGRAIEHKASRGHRARLHGEHDRRAVALPNRNRRCQISREMHMLTRPAFQPRLADRVDKTAGGAVVEQVRRRDRL